MNVGGYNQFDLKDNNIKLHKESYRFQSARAALYCYLMSSNVKLIYLPNYLCESIITPIKSLGIDIKFYNIDVDFLPVAINDMLKVENAKILLINYFGLMGQEINKIVKCNENKFIVDNSQALFDEHISGTTTIYSPRKFLSIPDGGFLITDEQINFPSDYYDSSELTGHLFLRAAGFVSEGYQKFLKAERNLEEFTPLRMSKISEYMINSIDIEYVVNARVNNFLFLERELKDLNQIKFNCDSRSGAPLCYPLKFNYNIKNMHLALVRQNVFLPRYWFSSSNGKVGKDMYENSLFLPIDERINNIDIAKIISLINVMRKKYE